MRGRLISLVFFAILLLTVTCVFGDPSGSITDAADTINDVNHQHNNNSSAGNLPLPLTPKHDTAIVAAPDGTIYFVDINSWKILWSFASGTPIYSSYQALPHRGDDQLNSSSEGGNFYVDCGEDWELYVHANGFQKVKLPFSAEEFLKRTPFVSTDGGVMLGSKKTTVFLVDVKTGNVIHTFRSDDIPSDGNMSADEDPVLARNDIEEWRVSSDRDLERVDELLHVTRTDYALKYTSAKTGKLLWHLKFADIEASFQCRGINNLGGFFSGDAGLGPHNTVDMNLPLHCQKRPLVYRIRDGGLPSALPGPLVLPLPAADEVNPEFEPAYPYSGSNQKYEGNGVPALPASQREEFGIISLPGGNTDKVDVGVASDILAGPYSWPFVLVVIYTLLIGAFISYLIKAARNKVRRFTEVEEPKMYTVTPKKKKSRKSGSNKHNPNAEKSQKKSLYSEKVTNGRVPEIANTDLFRQTAFLNDGGDLMDGRKVGKLFVSNKEIAKGSNGTVVLEGCYDGRPVAVKRLVQTHHEVALKEIQNLIASDQHPNIVRWYGVEYDKDFVYLSLERCTCSLHELILLYSISTHEKISSEEDEPASFSNQWLGENNDFSLWKEDGYPSPQLLKLMRDIVRGLAHLHELGIIHRDLKPQNVLVIKRKSVCAKLSDMGISKRLAGDMSSLTRNATGYGSSGWQSPEQLRHERQTRAVDLFSLGCVLFFCITGGRHPFGDTLERDVNIVNNRKDLFLIEHIPEATDLISRLLDPNPELRPKTAEILHHPLFWTSEMRLSFLRDASDRVELEDRVSESEILKALESIGTVALGGKWDEKMDDAFINDIGRYRRYRYDSVRDLLRVIRNKLNHYRELSKEIQGILGQVPEGFDNYFTTRFPKLLVEVHKVFQRYCGEEETFHKYFRSNQT